MSDPVVIHLDLPADTRYLSVLGVCLGEMLTQYQSVPEQTRYNIGLAAHEICANMAEHAYAGAEGRLAITLRLQGKSFFFEARDHGQRAFDPTCVPMPDPTAFDRRGRGLWLVYQLTDAVTYAARDGYTWEYSPANEQWQRQPTEVRAFNQWNFRKDF